MPPAVYEWTGVILVYFLMIFTAVRIVMDTSNASKALGYLAVTFTLPVLGSIIYFTFGVNYRKKRIYNKKLAKNEQLWQTIQNRINEASTAILQKYRNKLAGHTDLVRMIINDVQEPLSVNKVDLMHNGEQKFPSLKYDLENAQHSIHLLYYIFKDDELGEAIGEILKRKAKEGVTVRFLYDDYGSSLSRSFIKNLRKAGVEVYPFFRVYFPLVASRVNYRNHRKIVVIDGRIGYTGGINIARYYENRSGQMYWRDSHIRIKGGAVLRLQYHFLSDWNFCSGQSIDMNEQLFPPDTPNIEGESLMQVISSGPDCPRPSIMLSYMTAFAAARKRIFITTPYFIPNDSIYDAIRQAALSGKDVRLLVPMKTDSRLVNAAARSYFQELLDCGVKIYRYTKGFIHAKTVVVDEALSIVGTANMDYRSFEFNFEVNTVIYDSIMNEKLSQNFMNDIKDAEFLNSESWQNRSKLKQLRDRAARLLSPLM